MFNHYLLIHPVLMVQLLLTSRVPSSHLTPPPHHCSQLSVDAGLSLVGELVKVDALATLPKGRGQYANVFFLLCSQCLHLIELKW